MSIESDFRKLSRQVDRLVKQGERNIGRHYAGLLKDVQHNMADWFAKYADADGKLNYSDLQKYDRISKLEKELRDTLKQGTALVAKEIRDVTRQGIITSYDGVVKSVGENAGKTIRGVLDPKKINNIMQNPFSGLTLNERLSLRRADIEVRIRETITQGLSRGETYKTMADRLKVELENDAVKAMRIVRTETHRTVEAGKHEALQGANKQGVPMKKWWMMSFDERVRDSHAWMGHNYAQDNMIPFDEDFENPATGGKGPHPGMMGTASDDCNCRCNMMIELITE